MQAYHGAAAVLLLMLIPPGTLAAQRPVGPPADQIQLVRELAIGGDPDRPEYEFLAIGSTAVTRSGTVFVSVADGPTTTIVRKYDAAGSFRGNIGRMGSGPGEYQGVEGLGIVGDTLLVVLDPRLRRASLFDTTGTFRRSFPVAGPAWSGLHSYVFYTDGTVGVRAMMAAGSRTEAMPSVMIRYRLNGAVADSLQLPLLPAGGIIMMHRSLGPRWPFADQTVFSLLPRGGLATARTTRYRVDVVPAAGPRFSIERNAQPIPVDGEEREEWEAMMAMGPPRPREVIPRQKPFIRDLLADSDGRIWVSLYTVATRRAMPPRPGVAERAPTLSHWEHNAYEVFDPRGRFLGRVDLAPFSKLVAVSGDRIWVAEELEDGGFALVRYRLQFPPGR